MTSLAGSTPPAEAVRWITFMAAGRLFALPLDTVREIQRPPALVHVPLGPVSLDGLANLRGAVTPVLDTARALRLAERLVTDENRRLLVLDRTFPVGMMVDRLGEVVTARADRFDPASGVELPVDPKLVTGMIRAREGESVVFALDAEAVVDVDCSRLSRIGAGVERVVEASARKEEAARLLVGFEAGGQEFAIPVEAVGEIVRIPPGLSKLPRSEGQVLGIVAIRDHLLPLLSARRMFGLPAADIDDQTKVLVLTLEGGAPVGLVVDRAREILRVPERLMEPVPSLLTRGGANAEIEAICRLDGGRRLVSVISPTRLFRNEAVRDALAVEAELKEESAIMNGTAFEDSGMERFVLIELAGQEYGFPVEAVEEVLRLPDTLTRVPKAPRFIEGIVNRRGAALPVIDQRRRLGLPASQDSLRRILVVAMGERNAGFIVDRVLGVVRVATDAIAPAPALSEEQQRLISRVASIGDRLVLLLDPDQLLGQEEIGRLAKLATQA